MLKLGVILLSFITLAPQPKNVRTVTLTCGNGWRAGAVGQVGGVPFDVQCDNGRGKARLVGVSGTGYSTRVGVESDTVAGDCFFSGETTMASHTCLEVQLSIQ